MIAHIDADSFFASVIIRTHPHLRGKALLAIGMGGGCVIAATYEAKAKGIKTGMRLSEARKLCPGATEMAADFRETALASKQIEETIQNHCPIVEQMSIDEWYLDLASLVDGIPEDLMSWGKDMQRTILQNTGLSVSIGIAGSKLLAKMAGEYRKPAGVTLIEKSPSPLGGGVRGGGPEEGNIKREGYVSTNIETFLKDRPAAAIPGIGPRREPVAKAKGWHTAWDIALADTELMKTLFGKPGLEMQRELLGECLYPVREHSAPPKSISRCRSFRATADTTLVKAHLLKHLEYCTMKMRRFGLACREISIWIRTADYQHVGSHHRLSRSTVTADEMIPCILGMLEKLTWQKQRYTQAGLALMGLAGSGALQRSLFEDPQEMLHEESLQKAFDTLHARFGRDSITRAAALPVNSGTRKELDLPMVG